MSAIMTGQRHWQSPDQLRIKKEPGFGNRYIRKADVERRLDEGWEIVMKPLRLQKEGGTDVDRAQHYRGLILMRMPQDMIDQRNKYYQELHHRRLRAVARGAHMTAAGRAATRDNADSSELAGTIGEGLKVRQGVMTEEGLKHTDNIDISVSAHPDDLREDAKIAAELKEEMAAGSGENGEGALPPPPRVKSKNKRR